MPKKGTKTGRVAGRAANPVMQSTAVHTTRYDFERRVATVVKLRLAGWTRADIHELAANGRRDKHGEWIEKPWGLAVRTVDEYIARATDVFKEEAKKDFEETLATSLARYDDMYKAARSAGDLEQARLNMNSIDKLKGHNAPEKQEHTVKDVNGLGLAEVAAELALILGTGAGHGTDGTA